MGVDDYLIKEMLDQEKKNDGLKWRGDYYPESHKFEHIRSSSLPCTHEECNADSDYRLNFEGSHISFDGDYCFEHSVTLLTKKLLFSINNHPQEGRYWGQTAIAEHARKGMWREKQCDDTSQLIKWMSLIPIDYRKKSMGNR